jgi:CIC family chloride channel protein
MVIGAVTGAAVWRLLELVAPGVPVSPAPFVIVGMMACFGSIGHIPFATMLMVSEMTGNLSLLPAAMVAVGIATLITRDQHIYSAQLRSRADSPAHRFRYPLTPLGTLPLSAATVPPPVKLRITDVAAAVREGVAAAPLHAAPVVDEQGFLVGTLTAESLRAAADDATIASLTDRTAPTATVDFTLEAGMELLAMSQSPWAPVVGSDRRLAGIVTAQGLLRRYRSALRSSMRRLEVLSGSPVVEARIPAGSPLAGKTVADVPLPADTVIVTVQRGPQALFATAATALAEDDLLTIFSRSSTGSGLHLPGVEVLAPRSEGEPVVAT